MTNMSSKLSDDDWLKNDLSHSMTSLSSVCSFDNYRMIPIYPTEEDLYGPKPSALCANKVNCVYKDCDEYLGIFFRLMREDFMSIVRDHFCYLYNNRNTILNPSQLESKKIWYYSDVKILERYTRLSVIVFQFDSPDHAQKLNYENSEKFKNGALILLSKDRFETYVLGIVVETYNLNRGRVGIDVVSFKEVKQWCKIDLVESSVFYEPYRYIMGVFQDMNEENFPMKEYIVYGHKTISSPRYLAKNSVYKINEIEFDILKYDQWPPAEVLNMDVNQYQAFKGALIKEFAMIQGPPGTGKTYIGLEIIKIIIENMYYTKKLTNPILIVCMTNHALDQFLEGIWKITTNISRFGRGTKSQILEDYIPKLKLNNKNMSAAKILVKANRDAAAFRKGENLHVYNISEVDRNCGILDLSNLINVLNAEGYENCFEDSYDLCSWLLFGISNVDGVNPIDFIKTNKLLSAMSINFNGNPTKRKLYCISLESITLYCTKVQYQLSKLNLKDDDLSKKNHLQLSLKVMKTVKEYMIKHLKLYNSSTFIEVYNRKIVHLQDCFELRDRWLLYYSWVHSFMTMESKFLEDVQDSVLHCRKRANKFKSVGYLNPVKDKYVIGMTTTAAAKNRFLLKKLKCPIVIIEEAAEILEPHIVSSLSEYCEHLILIGDHKQLRPQTANHIMGEKYNLNISLFERMVNNGIPSFTLAEQHRMRPEIAGLVAPAIYPHLRNHPSVENRPHIKGVDKDIFCINHNVHENKDYKLSSFVNETEAKFLVALADYLLKQGYYPEDITIMAMYNAQVSYISDLIKSNNYYECLENIRITSVDGYQGEENEIVLLSLVRSNNFNSVGFLKIDNRVCVALSRARLGFYMIGDLNLLARISDLWKKIKNYLQRLNAIGPNLLLKCQNHNTILGKVSNHLDFRSLNFCKLKCNNELICGHLCDKVCHINIDDHLAVQCLKACEKKCFRNHDCHKMCYEICKCETFISEICDFGHLTYGKCCEVENKCLIKVIANLDCGHLLEKNCYEPSICNEVCNKLNPKCIFKHLCKNRCGVICGLCSRTVFKVMECGHILKLECNQILDDKLKCTECKVSATKKRAINNGCAIDVGRKLKKVH